MRNGEDEETPNTLRLIALVARMNDAFVEFMALLRELLAGQRVSSDRLARLESVVEKVHEIAIGLAHNVDEARDDIDEVRRDQTDPKGVRLLDPAQYPLRKKEDDDGALVAAARLAEKVPPTWVAWVLKLGLPITGAIGLRLWQWFVAGH